MEIARKYIPNFLFLAMCDCFLWLNVRLIYIHRMICSSVNIYTFIE